MRFILTVFILALLAAPSFADALRLNDIVVGIDRAEPEAPVFPLRALSGYGALYLEPLKLNISKNCAKFIRVETDKLTCAPFGNESQRFTFATFGTRKPEDDSSWVAVFLQYNTDRVTLKSVADTQSDTFRYFLEIQ